MPGGGLILMHRHHDDDDDDDDDDGDNDDSDRDVHDDTDDDSDDGDDNNYNEAMRQTGILKGVTILLTQWVGYVNSILHCVIKVLTNNWMCLYQGQG